MKKGTLPLFLFFVFFVLPAKAEEWKWYDDLVLSAGSSRSEVAQEIAGYSHTQDVLVRREDGTRYLPTVEQDTRLAIGTRLSIQEKYIKAEWLADNDERHDYQIIEAGETPGLIAQDLKGDWRNWNELERQLASGEWALLQSEQDAEKVPAGVYLRVNQSSSPIVQSIVQSSVFQGLRRRELQTPSVQVVNNKIIDHPTREKQRAGKNMKDPPPLPPPDYLGTFVLIALVWLAIGVGNFLAKIVKPTLALTRWLLADLAEEFNFGTSQERKEVRDFCDELLCRLVQIHRPEFHAGEPPFVMTTRVKIRGGQTEIKFVSGCYCLRHPELGGLRLLEASMDKALAGMQDPRFAGDWQYQGSKTVFFLWYDPAAVYQATDAREEQAENHALPHTA